MLVFALLALYSKCFKPNYATSVRNVINRKICCYMAKATEYYWKLEPTCLSRLKSFSKVISNCSILQSNASKLDRYIVTSHSVSGSKCSFTAFVYKYFNFYCYIPRLSLNKTSTLIGWFLVTCPWSNSNVSWPGYNSVVVARSGCFAAIVAGKV